MMDASGLTELGAKLAEFFALRSEVHVAYLFGSQARGTPGPMSDTDIAVLLASEIGQHDYGRLKVEFLTELTLILGTDQVDLVILNQASPVLAFEVVREGRVIYAPKPEALAGFRTKAIREFLATQHLRNIFDGYLHQRARSGQFGMIKTREAGGEGGSTT